MCTLCEKVGLKIYEFLSQFSDDPSFQWICLECVESRRKSLSEIMAMKESQLHLKGKVYDLSKGMNRKFDELIKQKNRL